MIIVNYTSESYKPILDLTLPSWSGEKIIYSDSDQFGFKFFEKSDDYNQHCERKILTLLDVLKKNPGKDLLWLDTDCFVREMPNVFEDYSFDIACTRMVRRKVQKRHINAGVIFFRANPKTLDFVEKWLNKAIEYRGKPFHEQTAFHSLAYEAYDEILDVKLVNVSEEVYNYERDSAESFLADLHPRAKILHLKQGLWKNEEILKIL